MRFDQTHCLAAIRAFQNNRIVNQFLENAAQSFPYQGVIIDKKNFHRQSSLNYKRNNIFDAAREGSRRRGGSTHNNGFPYLAEGFPAPPN